MFWNGAWQPVASGYWGGEIMPYVKNQQVFRCPSKRDTVCSYIYNQWFSGRADAAVERPADMVVTGDSTGNGWWALDGSGMVPYYDPANPANRNPGCRLLDTHNEGTNFAFADGHAKWLQRRMWKPSQWNTGWTP